MKEQTGDTYESSPYAKAMILAEAKVGKSCGIIAGLLGVLPWQKNGGVVDHPSNLHIIATDSNALGGVKRFLLETCKAPAESLQFKVYNMQADLLKASGGEEYDYTFLDTVSQVLEKIDGRKRGVPVVLASSLTGLAEGLLNGVRSPPGQQNGGGMSIPKWSDFSLQVSHLRNAFHSGDWHCIWEAHVLKMIKKIGDNQQDEESVQIPGKSGVNFPYNVEQVFRMRRLFGQKYEGTNCDKVYLDPRPNYDFIANGRNFNEALKDQEYDITSVFHRLGLKVGRWGAKTAPVKAVKK